jgi:hypothetical protein
VKAIIAAVTIDNFFSQCMNMVILLSTVNY